MDLSNGQKNISIEDHIGVGIVSGSKISLTSKIIPLIQSRKRFRPRFLQEYKYDNRYKLRPEFDIGTMHDYMNK